MSIVPQPFFVRVLEHNGNKRADDDPERFEARSATEAAEQMAQSEFDYVDQHGPWVIEVHEHGVFDVTVEARPEFLAIPRRRKLTEDRCPTEE